MMPHETLAKLRATIEAFSAKHQRRPRALLVPFHDWEDLMTGQNRYVEHNVVLSSPQEFASTGRLGVLDGVSIYDAATVAEEGAEERQNFRTVIIDVAYYLLNADDSRETRLDARRRLLAALS